MSVVVTFFSMLVEEIMDMNATLWVVARSAKGLIVKLMLDDEAVGVGREVVEGPVIESSWF